MQVQGAPGQGLRHAAQQTECGRAREHEAPRGSPSVHCGFDRQQQLGTALGLVDSERLVIAEQGVRVAPRGF